MIISEKQIMQLISLLQLTTQQSIVTDSMKRIIDKSCVLLNEIYDQQSEELKEDE